MSNITVQVGGQVEDAAELTLAHVTEWSRRDDNPEALMRHRQVFRNSSNVSPSDR